MTSITSVPTSQPQGVVTLADANYFPGLAALATSIRTSRPYPLACYNIGLTPEQRQTASSWPDVQVLDLPADPLIGEIQLACAGSSPLAKPGKRIWPLWICPILIQHSPFEEVFWLDCDILVLRGLDELFERLAGGPVFTPENRAPSLTPNKPELYDLLPIDRPFDRNVPVVNGGVSGWRKGRDRAALEAYREPVERAARDPRIMEAISWHDQGALIWAIQSLGLEDRVLSADHWNMSIDHISLDPEALAWDDQLCTRLRAALPDVRLVHWNGHPTPWSAQGRVSSPAVAGT
jgi:hypothetical protein